MSQALSLDQATAIVTGGSRGIGFAIASDLLAAGANVCITGRTEADLADAEAALGATGRTVSVAGNSADPGHRAEAVAAAVSSFGRVDLLVNNAATSRGYGPLLDTELDSFSTVFELNVASALGWVQEAHRSGMGARGGAIVNVASVAGFRSAANIGPYAVSKAALIHLTRQLAFELGPAIRVNAVAPAVVRTKFAAPLYSDEQGLVKTYPLGRIGEPEDVAGAVRFLLGPESAWITGETLVLDGGLTAGGGFE